MYFWYIFSLLLATVQNYIFSKFSLVWIFFFTIWNFIRKIIYRCIISHFWFCFNFSLLSNMHKDLTLSIHNLNFMFALKATCKIGVVWVSMYIPKSIFALFLTILSKINFISYNIVIAIQIVKLYYTWYIIVIESFADINLEAGRSESA